MTVDNIYLNVFVLHPMDCGKHGDGSLNNWPIIYCVVLSV